MPRSRTFQSTVAIVVLCAVGVPAWRWVAQAPVVPAAPPMDLGAVPVALQTLEPRSVTVRIRAYGTLRALADVTLAVEVPGRIDWVWDGWQMGAEAVQGQELVRVDPSRLELELGLAEARREEVAASERSAEVERRAAEAVLGGVREELELARRDEERWEAAGDSVAPGELDRSRAARVRAQRGLREAEAAIERADAAASAARARRGTLAAEIALIRDRVERCVLRAPIAGRLGAWPPTRGRLVAAGEVLGTLTDETSFLMHVDVPQSQRAGIVPGAAARVRLSGAGGSAGPALAARVSGLATRADPATRSVGVELELSAGSAGAESGSESSTGPFVGLVAGAFAEAEMDAGEARDGLWIERGHFRWEDGQPIAYVHAEGRAVRRAIELGPEVGEGFVLAGGLLAGEQLITEPLDRLWDGREVVAR